MKFAPESVEVLQALAPDVLDSFVDEITCGLAILLYSKIIFTLRFLMTFQKDIVKE